MKMTTALKLLPAVFIVTAITGCTTFSKNHIRQVTKDDVGWAAYLYAATPTLYSGVNGEKSKLPSMAEAVSFRVESSKQNANHNNAIDIRVMLPETLLVDAVEQRIMSALKRDMRLFYSLFPRFQAQIELTITLMPAGVYYSASSPMLVKDGLMRLEFARPVVEKSCLHNKLLLDALAGNGSCTDSIADVSSTFLHEFAHYYGHEIIHKKLKKSDDWITSQAEVADQVAAGLVTLCTLTNSIINDKALVVESKVTDNAEKKFKLPFNINPDFTGVTEHEARAMTGSEISDLISLYVNKQYSLKYSDRAMLMIEYMFLLLADKHGMNVSYESDDSPFGSTRFALNDAFRDDLCRLAGEILELPHNVDQQWSLLTANVSAS